MNGSAISLLVDGVARITATDAAITAPGGAGVRLGLSTSTAPVSDTTGLQLDDFRVTSLTTTAADSRAANHGAFANGPLLNEAGALIGDSDRAAELDGIDDYVSVPDTSSLDLGNGPLTLEAWVKRSNADTGFMSLFNKGAGASQFAFTANRLYLAKETMGTLTSATTTVTDTSWHHLVATKSGTVSKLYIDGVDRSGAQADQALANTAAALLLGATNGSSEFLAGTIDEFAAYNSVLTAAQVADHYRAGTGTG